LLIVTSCGVYKCKSHIVLCFLYQERRDDRNEAIIQWLLIGYTFVI